jgi:signal transduction histidine kinase
MLFIRPKLFLTFLGLCLAPLVLLALMNYRTGVSLAGRALRTDQESRLAEFKSAVAELLQQDQSELIGLSRSRALGDYVRTRSQRHESSLASQLAPATASEEVTDQVNATSLVPVALRARVALVLNSRPHLVSISLFERSSQPLFVAERQADYDEPVIFHVKDFLSGQPQPDNRVWTLQMPVLLSEPAPGLMSTISTGTLGALMDYTVPVFDAKQEPANPRAALVEQLKLDPIFSEAAREDLRATNSAASEGVHRPVLFIVTDRSGRILYHPNEALKHQQISDSMAYFQPVANKMFSSLDGNENFISPTGDTYSASYTRIPLLDVSLAAATNYDQAVAEAHVAGKLGLLVSVLLATLVAALLTLYWQRQTRGLERVTEGVEAIAKGKLDHRIELQSSDDLRPLADNLGLMTKQLREQIAREAETKQFQSFVRLSAILTHDLKNAIEALSLTVANMEWHFDNKEFRADAMKSVMGATNNLRALVARLTNPVTTLSGEHKRPQPVDLVPMLRQEISMIAEPARGKHEIKVELPEFLFALVDGERMNKVVENLIINALEAMNREKGTLSIAAGTTDEGKPYFSVSDTGEGMSERFMEEKLFRPFATTKRRGVGLGLYTCREVVVANGGAIEVDSQEGAGTTFRVVLPSTAIDKSGEKQPHSQSHG